MSRRAVLTSACGRCPGSHNPPIDAVVFITRLLLAGVFLVAGLTKLGDRAGARRAIVDFGAPASVAAPLALSLALLEVAIAIALLRDDSATAAATAALVLLAVFAIAIAVNLSRGRTPECHCFGELHSAPVGGGTLARSGVLAALAALVAWQGPGAAGDAVGWIGELRPGEAVALALVVALLLTVALQGWLLLSLLRQNGRLLKRVDALETAVGPTTAVAADGRAGLPPGTRAPGFTLPAASGEAVTLQSLAAAGKPVVLVFTDPDCAPCVELTPELGEWQREYGDRLTVAVITRKDDGHEPAWIAEHGVHPVLIQDRTEVLDAYEAFGTPSAVVVAPDTTIASRAAFGADAIRALVGDWAGMRFS
jgi:peroxiredoxin/uncharacterized membrane protein YphA (DoxX/SURF4 family)